MSESDAWLVRAIGMVSSARDQVLDDDCDGTPLLDIKPYMEEFAPRTAVRQPAWSRELMAGYF